MTAVTIAFVALTVYLGQWQSGRAQYKAALQAELDKRSMEAPIEIGPKPLASEEIVHRPIVAHGRFDIAHEILIDNKVHRGRAGYHVVTPLRLDGSDISVLVLRGWTEGGRTRAQLPTVKTPAGPIAVEGIAVQPSERVLELADEQPGKVWQNLLLDRYAQWSGLKIQPFVLQQTSDLNDGLIRDWPRPDFGIDKHRGYALQWYSFAALAVVLYFALNLKRDESPDA